MTYVSNLGPMSCLMAKIQTIKGGSGSPRNSIFWSSLPNPSLYYMSPLGKCRFFSEPQDPQQSSGESPTNAQGHVVRIEHGHVSRNCFAMSGQVLVTPVISILLPRIQDNWGLTLGHTGVGPGCTMRCWLDHICGLRRALIVVFDHV